MNKRMEIGGKPLERIEMDKVPAVERRRYIFNEKEGMAIRVPDDVRKALGKIYESEYSDFCFDLLAMIIRYRKMSGAHEHLKVWEQNSVNHHKYPPILAHKQIYKLLEGKGSPFLKVLTKAEIEALRVFICLCPEGYDLRGLILAHNEFLPIFT